MGKRALLGPLAVALLVAPAARGESLDSFYDEIKSHGGMTGLCQAKPDIDECKYGVGEWKPEELQRAKNRSPFCINTCKHDFFGFVQSPTGDREYPIVRTKDFSPGATSRGVEISLFPVAVKVYEYRACNGCNHVRTSPVRLTSKIEESVIEMPLIGRGTFYIPSKFRELALRGTKENPELTLTMSDDRETTAQISIKAMREYSKMLRALRYDFNTWNPQQ